MLAFFLQGIALGLPAAASPGPLQAYLINTTLTGGWRRGIVISLSPLISDGPIVVVILLLLDRIPPGFLRWINIAGGTFVLYIAWGLWRQWRAGNGSSKIKEGDHQKRRGLWHGVALNAVSPGLYTFWAFVNGPLLLSALRQSPWHGIAFLAGFYGTLIGGFAGIVVLSHQAHRLRPQVVRTLTLISIWVLLAFGAFLLYQGIWK